MATKYTAEERKALLRKINSPEEKVVCPRCGKELGYRAIGTSCEVKCPTKDCLHGAVRGI